MTQSIASESVIMNMIQQREIKAIGKSTEVASGSL